MEMTSKRQTKALKIPECLLCPKPHRNVVTGDLVSPHCRVLPDLQALLPAATVPLRLRPEWVPVGATLQKKEARGQRIEKWNNYSCDLDGGGGWWLYHYKYNSKAFSTPFVHSCSFSKMTSIQEQNILDWEYKVRVWFSNIILFCLYIPNHLWSLTQQ